MRCRNSINDRSGDSNPVDKMKYIVSLLIFVHCSLLAEEILVVTENINPYSFEENGVLKGVNTAVVRAIFERANIPYRIELREWTSSYHEAITKPDVFIYPLMVNQKRLEAFDYVAELSIIDACLYRLARRNDIKVEELSDAKNLRVGVVIGSWGEQLLIQEGFSWDRNIHRRNHDSGFLSGLEGGAIDLWFVPRFTALTMSEKLGIKLAAAYCIEETEAFYLATQKSSDPILVNAIKKSFDSLKQDGTFEEILATHGVSPN